MAEEEEYVDYYGVLGAENSKDDPLTAKQLSKLYRKLALKYHPDKQDTTKQSQKELDAVQKKFEAISKANEVLQDATARAKFDAKYFAKRAMAMRYEQQDKQTKRKIDELRAREKRAFAEHQSAQHLKRQKLRIGQIRQADKSFVEEYEQLRRDKELLKERERNRRRNMKFNMHAKDVRRELKLSWSSKKLQLTHDSILEMFSKIGKVVSVTVYGKKRNRATVAYEKASCAARAIENPEGCLGEEAKGLRIEFNPTQALETPSQSSLETGTTEAKSSAMPWETATWQDHLAFENRVLSSVVGES